MDDSIIRFGEFEIDRKACELRSRGQRVPLQIQSFRVLEVLVTHAGQVVTRATLRASVWPENVFVDFDHGLNNAINRIRQALGDSGEDPRFVETLPRIGYRFVHPLDLPPAGQSPASVSTANPSGNWRTAIVTLGVAIIGAGAVGVAHRMGIRPAPAPEEIRENPATQIVQANEAYLRGMRYIEQRNKESQKLAIQQLQQATELDPNFAAAFAALAQAYAGAGSPTNVQFLNPDEARGPALAAAENALRLAPDLPQAHRALAQVLGSLQPWSRATDLAIEQSFVRAIKLDPANADAHLQFGNFLAKRRRGEEALAQFRQALELDPLSPSINSRLGQELMSSGATAEGLELLRKTVELEPFQFNARTRLAWGYLAVDNLDAAEQQMIAAEGISPGSVHALSTQSLIASLRGNTARARELLSEILPLAASINDPLSVAIAYVGLKDRENALEWLTRTARQTRALHRASPWDLQASIYDWLREDERFKALEREIAATAGED